MYLARKQGDISILERFFEQSLPKNFYKEVENSKDFNDFLQKVT